MNKYCQILCLLLLPFFATAAERPLFEMVDIEGVRKNQLVGYGLVVGLDGTGDKSQVAFTGQSVENMLKQFGVQLDGAGRIKTKNVAAVMVTATMDSSVGTGQNLDVVVSSMGDAKSLRGGTLLMTPLLGVDGETYAVAQGNLVVSAVSAGGENGSSYTVNTPTGGTIPNGAVVERALATNAMAPKNIVLNLKIPSYTTSKNIAAKINDFLGAGTANALSNGRVDVLGPQDPSQRVAFMSLLETVRVNEGPTRARIVFNARTGTIVIGQNVQVREAAVAHGNLTVTVTEVESANQPNEFGQGETVEIQDSIVDVAQGDGQMRIVRESVTLAEIVAAVNAIGGSPDDLMSILQALHEVGALDAELIVI